MNRRTFFSSLIGAALTASTRWLPMPSAPTVALAQLTHDGRVAGEAIGRAMMDLRWRFQSTSPRGETRTTICHLEPPTPEWFAHHEANGWAFGAVQSFEVG